MREFAVGDVHGCARSLASLLESIQPQKSDTIVFLGDYIDRGPDSSAVLDTILKLNQQCTVIALAGNHEKMLLQSRSDPDGFAEWLKQGGRATLASYGRRGLDEDLSAILTSHWRFLEEQTLDYWETDQQIFVHASIDPDLDLDEQPDFLLFWQPFAEHMAHKSGKQIVCGHTSQKSGLPALFDGGICIDTFAYGGGWLTCLECNEQICIQANERGEHRQFKVGTLKDL